MASDMRDTKLRWVPPFSMVIRLFDIALDCGALTREIYDTAPGGYWGKFVFGHYRGVRVAVKILAPKADIRRLQDRGSYHARGAM